MSRVAKKPVVIPSGVDVSLSGQNLSIKGKNGTLALAVNAKLKLGNPPGLDPSLLAYQPEEIRGLLQKGDFESARRIFPPITLNPEACTQCGVCAEVCPMDAVTFSPHLEIASSCISCFNCVRHCPEGLV